MIQPTQENSVSPFHVTFNDIADERLSALLTATNAAGFATPTLTPVAGTAAPVLDTPAPPLPPASSPLAGAADFPDEWRLVSTLDGQSYVWPKDVREEYFSYSIYAGETSREGTVHIALGHAGRVATWERDREYVVAFLTTGKPQNALVEFLETDDHAETGQFIAVIRGRDGARSKKMFSPTDELPEVYREQFDTVVYNAHIRVKGSWEKMAVLAAKGDPATMLNHALLQARRRGDV